MAHALSVYWLTTWSVLKDRLRNWCSGLLDFRFKRDISKCASYGVRFTIPTKLPVFELLSNDEMTTSGSSSPLSSWAVSWTSDKLLIGVMSTKKPTSGWFWHYTLTCSVKMFDVWVPAGFMFCQLELFYFHANLQGEEVLISLEQF